MDPNQYNQPDPSAPDLSAPQGPEGQEAQQIDPAYVSQLEQRTQAAEAAALRAQQAATAASVAEANRAYEARRAKAVEEAREKEDPSIVDAFHEQERQREHGEIRQAFAGALVNTYRQDLQKRYGLRDDQMIFLGENPDMMEMRAGQLAQQNQQVQSFQQTVDQAFLGQQAHERIMMNADRIGGMRGGQGRPEPTYEKGSLDHLRDRLFGDGQIFIE